jgi:hypothetical protein
MGDRDQARPARRSAIPQQPVTVLTIGDPAAAPGSPQARMANALAYLQLEVMMLEQREQLDRITDATLAMLPALAPRSTAVELVSKAVDHLLGKRPRWEPPPGIVAQTPVCWYRPGQGDSGMPVHRRAEPEPPARWHDPSGVRAAYDRAFRGDSNA